MQWILESILAGYVAGVLCAPVASLSRMVWLGFWLVLFLTSIWLVKTHPRQALWTIAALFFATGAIRHDQVSSIPEHDISKFANTFAVVAGEISDRLEVIAEPSGFKVRLVLKAQSIKADNKPPQPVTGKLAVTALCRQKPELVLGQKVAVRGKVRLPHGYNNPGQVDVVASLRRQGISARMTVQEDGLIMGPAPESPPLLQVFSDWRQVMQQRLLKVMPPEDAAILSGVLFGGYKGINPEVIRDFAATGIIHILSVSGTHIALTAGAILWLGGRLGWPYRYTAVAAGVSIVIYSLLAGFTPPVIRAAIMGLVSLTATCWGREKDVASALLVAGIIMLVYEPRLLYDLSFQLSFGATCGLVYLYPRFIAGLGHWPRWLTSGVGVTLTAQLGVLPFMAYYFNVFPLSSFVANIFIVPIIETVVILGLLGSLLGIVWDLAGNVLLVLCSLLIGLIERLTGWLANMGGVLYLPPMNLPAGILYYLLLFYLFGYRPPGWLSPKDYLKRYPTAFLTVIILAVTVVTVYYRWPRPVEVHFIDVGQGDAALIMTPRRQAVLIDSGGTAGSDFDIGERVVLPYLKHQGVRRLESLILTHGHEDHAGGAAAVLRSMPVGTLIIAQDAASPAVQAALRSFTGTVVPAHFGQEIIVDGVRFTVVHAATAHAANNNESSIVIRVNYGNHSFLFTGDLPASGEHELVRKGLAACTVLKVAHHGAKTSTSQEFLQAAAPKYAIISVGANNRFGHPHPEVVQRLEQSGAKIYRTDHHGAVVFTTDGVRLTVSHFIEVSK